MLREGDKIKVHRAGNRPVLGKIVRLYEFPPDLGVEPVVEYRSFYSGGYYLTRLAMCEPYKRRTGAITVAK